MDCSLLGSSVHRDSPGKYTGVGCHAFLQGIFPNQGSNPGLLHCRWILYQLSHQGIPAILEWIAYPFSRGSSWPRNWTGVSCIADRLFTSGLWLSSVQFSRVRLFATSWITACQASLSIANSRSSLKFTSIELVMPSRHLILCRPLLLLPPIPPSIRVFSHESTLRMRWPKYWSFSFSIIPSKEHPGLMSFRMDWLDLMQSKGLSRVFSNTTVQKHQFFGVQLSSQSNSHIHTWPLEKP